MPNGISDFGQHWPQNLPEPMLSYCQLDLSNKLHWNLKQNTKKVIWENPFETIVCKMAAMLFKSQYMKSIKVIWMGEKWTTHNAPCYTKTSILVKVYVPSSTHTIETKMSSFWRHFSSLAALKVVNLTTFSAGSDDNSIKITSFPFQYIVEILIQMYRRSHLTKYFPYYVI